MKILINRHLLLAFIIFSAFFGSIDCSQAAGSDELNFIESPFIFALNGQDDAEGPVNYDIYASFNRVITGGRMGEGVEHVNVILFHSTETTSTIAMADSCSIDLLTNNHSCQNNNAITFIAAPTSGQAAIKIDLSPKNNYSGIKFEIIYSLESKPTGFTVDIGDSISNNAWGGDGGQQSNDAEIQIYNTHVSIFGDDYTIGDRRLINAGYYVTAGSQINITIKNNYVAWQRIGGVPQEYKPDFVIHKATTEQSENQLIITPILCNNGNLDYINENSSYELIHIKINGSKKYAITTASGWQLSDDDCTDDLVAYIPLENLNPGYNSISIEADPLNIVEEFNEDNNIYVFFKSIRNNASDQDNVGMRY